MKIEVRNDTIRINDGISIYNDGFKCSYNNKGQYHNIDGSTIEYRNGNETWRFKGELHRLYGPARKWRNDNDEWWFFGGTEYTQEEFMENFL